MNQKLKQNLLSRGLSEKESTIAVRIFEKVEDWQIKERMGLKGGVSPYRYYIAKKLGIVNKRENILNKLEELSK